jgi:Mce-associated membrane protein
MSTIDKHPETLDGALALSVDDVTELESLAGQDVSDGQQAPSDDEVKAQVDRVRPRRPAAKVGVVALSLLALVFAGAAGYLKWRDGQLRNAQSAATESVQAASDDVVAILSYKPDTVDKDLSAAASRLTGDFRDSYSRLIKEVVAPGAKQQQISAVATVAGAASVSATENHAVVLVFVNQVTTIGQQPATTTLSSVRVTMDKVDGHWLVARFDPI